ncbi:hypothetical protein [Paraglaciecola hydrolytica]|uniref:DUF4252 domain-containing protein n=1 Tax=Paraglaciecola hydrolytica TaxID=1799789 RepID=A0A135ZZ51_9ALTE|nr:hypothetical protein [Paraglaciecola hydrolytica]KXI28268.1 hypothetical protein AX660_18005 [Paraglaciecola hydrolytica]
MKKRAIIIMLAMAGMQSPLLAKDSPQDSCKNAAALYADGDLDGALEEAKWCVTLLEQMKQENIAKFFKDSILGYKGAELESQNAMGFTSTKREYQKGDAYISVSLSGMATGSGMDAFAALAQIGLSAGGGKKVRIQKRSAAIMADGSNVQILVTLKKGGTLVFESNYVNADEVQKFAEAFPIEELDDSRG